MAAHGCFICPICGNHCPGCAPCRVGGSSTFSSIPIVTAPTVVDPLRDAIAALIEKHGSRRAAGRAIGIDHAFLARVHQGEKRPGKKLLRKLKLRAVTTYESTTAPDFSYQPQLSCNVAGCACEPEAKP